LRRDQFLFAAQRFQETRAQSLLPVFVGYGRDHLADFFLCSPVRELRDAAGD
jgi:hypothetical protein